MPNFNGTTGDDVFTGGADRDTLVGNGGADTLSGAGGNDLLVGNTGADKLDGGDGDDVLYSGDESPPYTPTYYNNGAYTAPLFDTGLEVDTLAGGDGNDRLFAGYGDNVDGGTNGVSWGDALYISFIAAPSGVRFDASLATQTIGGGTITGIEYVPWIQGSNFADDISLSGQLSSGLEFNTILGMGGNDKLTAGYYTGALYGGEGDDIVDGRPSQYLNVVDGGAGNDTLYARGFGAAYGGDGDDKIYGQATIHGGAGNDLVVAQQGHYSDWIYGDAGNDELRASSDGVSMSGGDGADILTGDAGRDVLVSGNAQDYGPIMDDMGLEHDVLAGFGGDDVLAGGYGDDIDGGSGADTLKLSLGGAASGVTMTTANIITGQSTALFGGVINSIEILSYLRGSDFADTLTLATQSSLLTVDAGAGDDVIISAGSSVSVNGGLGDDRFASGVAGDIFNGGAGFDTVDYDTLMSAATVNLATGVGAGGDQLTSVERIVGTKFADTFMGDSQSNSFKGGLGDDVMDGGVGNDTAEYSGASTDYSWTTANDGLTTIKDLRAGAANEGTDKLTSIEVLKFSDKLVTLSVTTTPPTPTPPTTTPPTTTPTLNVVQGTDAGSENLRGTSGNDHIKAMGGDDFLYGSLGDDTYDGGAGRDLVLFFEAGSAVTVDLAISGPQVTGQGTDTFVSIEALSGSAYSDTLRGDSGPNGISGHDGNDLIEGRGGDDSLSGDAGNDTIRGGDGNDNLTGGSGDDFVYGDAGDDYIWLSPENTIYTFGSDYIDGGSGNDTVHVAYTNVGVTINLGLVGPQQIAAGQMLTVVNVENLYGGYYNDRLTGNAGDNTIGGYDGDDEIDGGAGVDTLFMRGNSGEYTITQTADGWRIADKRPPVAYASGQISDGVDTVRNVEFVKFYDKTISLTSTQSPTSVQLTPPTITSASASSAISNILRGSPTDGQTGLTAATIANQLASNQISSQTAWQLIAAKAGATTSVATLTYQFFTGSIPTAGGMDFLVSAAGPNGNNLNSAYYQSFALENRYINFAVNLGKNGDGKAKFAADYGNLSLFDATKKAYSAVFGSMPTESKVTALLADGRDAYFAAYGGDGLSGIGTKAAMVGWLLAEAQKADLGTMAKANMAFLIDLADGATFGVDLVGVYAKPDFAYVGA